MQLGEVVPLLGLWVNPFGVAGANGEHQVCRCPCAAARPPQIVVAVRVSLELGWGPKPAALMALPLLLDVVCEKEYSFCGGN